MALDQLGEPLVEEIARLEPYGPGNPRPLFVARQLRVRGAPQCLGKATMKCWLTDGRLTYQAVAFRWGAEQPVLESGARLDIAFTPAMREWQGERSLQLELKDVRLV